MPFKLLSDGAWLFMLLFIVSQPGQIIYGVTICQSETHLVWMFCLSASAMTICLV